MQARELLAAGGCLRQSADGLHDAVELEGLQGAGMHGVRGWIANKRNP
jgi:hypothetical protein